MIEILKNLIAIESISNNEENIVNYVESLLRTTNGTLSRLDNILIWKNNWSTGKKTIALGAHLDTVPFHAEDWKITNPCTPLEKDGKIYGRGACDMKAGAAILIDMVLKNELGSNYNIMVFWYDREELGIPNGVTSLLEKNYFKNVDLCIIPEPTSGRVNYGVFGNLDAKLIAKGTAVHSSQPKLGRNALYELIPVIDNLRKHPLKTIATVEEAISVNMITGGTAINVVPDKVTASLDYRFNPNLSENEAFSVIKKYETEHVKAAIIGCYPGVIHEPSKQPLISKLIDIAGHGYVVPFWSDIGQLGAANIVAVNFGPGSINQAHTADEYVDINEIHFVKNTLIQFLNN